MPSPWIAWPHGTDPATARRRVSRAHEAFTATGSAGVPVRTVVLDSWRRCAGRGLDPERAAAHADLAEDTLRSYRAEHPLAAALPLVRRLLVDAAADSGQIVAVGDADGRLLWVEGERALRARAEAMGFVAGARWDEGTTGTNAPGTALAVDHAVQIFAAEHFSRAVHPWSCAAAPVHDPRTGAVLGVLDLTGGDQVAAPQVLSLVEAAATAVEGELRWRRLGERGPARPPVRPARLSVLGRDRAHLVLDGGERLLSPRHSEMLFLLTRHPEGLTADALEVLLREDDAAPVTVRAEMSRLRRLLGERALLSRPYRLAAPLRTDVDEVRALLLRGRHRQALNACPGPVLPRSTAPGVAAARAALTAEIRGVLLRHAAAEALADWADRPEGRDDPAVLRAAVRALPARSPRRSMLRARLTAACRPDDG